MLVLLLLIVAAANSADRTKLNHINNNILSSVFSDDKNYSEKYDDDEKEHLELQE